MCFICAQKRIFEQGSKIHSNRTQTIILSLKLSIPPFYRYSVVYVYDMLLYFVFNAIMHVLF